MCELHARTGRQSSHSVLQVFGSAIVLPVRLGFRAARFVLSPVANVVKGAVGQSVPFSNRRHIIIVPEWVEDLLGESGFAQLKASATGQAAHEGHALRRPGDDEMVQEIGSHLLQAMVSQSPENGTYKGHIKPEKWEFVVLDDPAVNACALPGGKVVVNTGFLNFIKRDKDKLAIVLGHEISHVLARHGVERMGWTLLLLAGTTLVVAWIRYSRANARARRRKEVEDELRHLQELRAQDPQITFDHNFRQRYGQLLNELEGLQTETRGTSQQADMAKGMFMRAAQGLIELPGSRRNEVEADVVGVRLARMAGFNVDMAAPLWEEMAAKHGGGEASVTTLLSTHPSSKTRSKILANEVALLKQHGWSKEALQNVFHKTSYWSM